MEKYKIYKKSFFVIDNLLSLTQELKRSANALETQIEDAEEEDDPITLKKMWGALSNILDDKPPDPFPLKPEWQPVQIVDTKAYLSKLKKEVS